VNQQSPSRRLRSRGQGEGRGEAGQAAVEFAFTITVMLLLIFGLIEFSRAIYAASVTQWAAQQGARTAIVTSATPAEIQAAIEDHLFGLDATQATVTVTQPTFNLVQVDVTYRYEFLIPIIARITGDSITLRASASMVAH
jgi:Flp pilus assembly protein TadG